MRLPRNQRWPCPQQQRCPSFQVPSGPLLASCPDSTSRVGAIRNQTKKGSTAQERKRDIRLENTATTTPTPPDHPPTACPPWRPRQRAPSSPSRTRRTPHCTSTRRSPRARPSSSQPPRASRPSCAPTACLLRRSTSPSTTRLACYGAAVLARMPAGVSARFQGWCRWAWCWEYVLPLPPF